MNSAKKSIYLKVFIPFLEDGLITSANANQNFEEFDRGLWQFLINLKWNEKLRLSNQLNFNIIHKTNVGNIRIAIYKNLNIDFMLN